MKNSKKLLAIIVATSVLTLGCTETSTNPSKDIVKEETDTGTNKNETKIMDDFMKLIKPETNASDIGNYIRDNIKLVSKSNSEKMIEYLMIYQTEIIEDFNEKMGRTDYIEALNKDMGGELEASRIKNISDEEVKQDYQNLIDGYLTIRRYEENPVVETDWKELSKYAPDVDEDLKQILKMNKKIQLNEYFAEKSDYNSILDRFAVSEDMVKVEDILKTNKSDFIEWQANKLYDLQLSTLIVGPEGEYLELWLTKDSEDYKDIIKIKNKYNDTKLGKIISALDNVGIDERVQVIDKIDHMLQFGVKSDSYLEDIKYSEDGNEYEVLKVKLSDNKEKEDRVNEIIKDDLDKYVDSLNIEENFTMKVYSDFANEKYISYSGFVNYKDDSIDNEILNLYRNLDYIKGEYINLEEYFGTSFDLIKDDLENITGTKFETMPEFQLSEDGITLHPIVEGEEQYLNLNYKDLIPYFTLKQLRHGK